MPRVENACPFDTTTRAQRCESCCASQGLPPCAIAWLRSRLSHGAPAALRTPIERQAA